MFESVEDMLKSPEYDKDLQDELSAACPNYMTVFLTSKRDLLRNDCGIVVAGETSAGKTTLINQLVKKKVFATSNLAATGTITRIRDSEKLAVKCYTKDETLKKAEEVADAKKLRSVIKGLTDISKIPEDLKDIYYVDVYLPVAISKGNVIIVDTPGIGENEKLDSILLDFLPHAVSFVFIVNAKNAGGIHEDRLSKILKTIMDNRENMPCFDPREVMFLTNQWDIIDNDDPVSDEDSENEEDDQQTQTWKLIQSKLSKGWGWFNVENVFRISLKQVDKGISNFFTDEYRRFETLLKETIHKNENKRVEFYYRFLKDFIRNAERGTLARLKLLERSENEQQRIMDQNNVKIRDLELKCKQSKEELVSYKTKITSQLTEKLYTYLNSSHGREEILNPPGKTKIWNVAYRSVGQEVQSRLQSGINRWCDGQEVKAIIEEADAKVRLRVKDIESKLLEIEIEMTGVDPRVEGSTIILGLGMSLGLLFLPFSIVFTFVFTIVFAPIYFAWGWVIGSAGVQKKADAIYDECVGKISKNELKEGFEKSFGVEYGKVIVRIFEESVPKVIESLLITNKKLLAEHKAIKEKSESFMRLKGKILKIQTATEHFESDFEQLHCH
ncbi:uncharacterized protein LOC134718824 isoform X2 [Mytilus trossulus]